MPSSTSSFDRTIPDLPWSGMALSIALIVAAAAVAWEWHARAVGYVPTLNDTNDVWADRREAVQPDSIVIVGDSRALFDSDLDVLEKGLGKRPVQLALVGSCAYPILANLAEDEKFHGTVICSLLPAIWLAPAGSPVANSEKALKRFKNRTVAQRASNQIGMWLEERVAFLKEDDLTLSALLLQLKLPNRPGTLLPPALPPYFSTMDRDRRTRMAEACATPGPLQDRVKYGWLPLFTPPPPPTYVPREAFLAHMGQAIEGRFRDTAAAVHRLQARGAKVVFVRFPMSGKLKEIESMATPKAGPWSRIIKESGAPGIYFEDYPELASFTCPEWSHLSGPDSVEFTKRLLPHLQAALAQK